eukprot:976057-Pyramimonas_sp.AAC.1
MWRPRSSRPASTKRVSHAKHVTSTEMAMTRTCHPRRGRGKKWRRSHRRSSAWPHLRKAWRS